MWRRMVRVDSSLAERRTVSEKTVALLGSFDELTERPWSMQERCGSPSSGRRTTSVKASLIRGRRLQLFSRVRPRWQRDISEPIQSWALIRNR